MTLAYWHALVETRRHVDACPTCQPVTQLIWALQDRVGPREPNDAELAEMTVIQSGLCPIGQAFRRQVLRIESTA